MSADVLHTPRIGLKAAQQIAAMQADAAVGVVDFDGLPAGIAEDLREGGPKLTLHDASALFAALRGIADPAEIALATKAAAIGRHALSAAQGDNSQRDDRRRRERGAQARGRRDLYCRGPRS